MAVAEHSCEEGTPETPARLSRVPRLLIAAAFTSSVDRFTITPMLVTIAGAFHTRLGPAVAAASGYFLAYGCSQPLWGLLSDRFGRVRLIRTALAAAAIAGGISAVAPSLWTLVVARVLTGACFGAVIPGALTYAGDTVRMAVRQRALSDMLAATATGTSLATVAAGAVASAASWRLVFAVPALAAGAVAVGLGRLAESVRPPSSRPGPLTHLRAALRGRWGPLVILLGFVEGGLLLGVMTFLPSALERQGVDASWAGLVTAFFGIGVLAFSRLVKLAARRPAWLLIGCGGVMMGAGYAAAATGQTLYTIGVTAFLLGGGWSFMHSTLQTWSTTVVPHARATMVAFFAASLFLGSAIGSALGATLAEQGRYSALFAVAAIVVAPLTLVATVARWRYRPPAQ